LDNQQIQKLYELTNEGAGGCIERLAYSAVIKKLAEQNKCKSICELGATYIAGIPAFNSCILAQAKECYEITLVVGERDYDDAVKIWNLYGLKANIIKWNTQHLNSRELGKFDFVYNHLAFEQQKNPYELVSIMKSLSNKIVMNLTLSPYNYGFFLHWIGHKLYNKPYDHGYAKNATISKMVEVHEECGLKILETGMCDCPPWMDTVDGKIGNSMTYMDIFPKQIREKWIWTSVNPECQNHWQMKLLLDWENNLPSWFKMIFAHHLYCASLVE
jgi:hypothetical protein